MSLALVALVLTLPAASPAGALAPARGVQAPICGQDLKVRPIRVRQPAPAKRLGELPPGDLTLAVVNRVGRCIEPLTVRQGYGAAVDGAGR
jgi:hypothetical protein